MNRKPNSPLGPIDFIWVVALIFFAWEKLPGTDSGGGGILPSPPVKQNVLTKSLNGDKDSICKAAAVIKKFASLLDDDRLRDKKKMPSFAAAQMRIANMGDCIVGVMKDGQEVNWAVKYPQFDDELAKLVKDIDGSGDWSQALSSRLRSVVQEYLE